MLQNRYSFITYLNLVQFESLNVEKIDLKDNVKLKKILLQFNSIFLTTNDSNYIKLIYFVKKYWFYNI